MAHDLRLGKRTVNGSFNSKEVPRQVDVSLRSEPRAMSEFVLIVDSHCYAEQKLPSQERLPFLFAIGTFQVVTIPDPGAGTVITCISSRDPGMAERAIKFFYHFDASARNPRAESDYCVMGKDIGRRLTDHRSENSESQSILLVLQQPWSSRGGAGGAVQDFPPLQYCSTTERAIFEQIGVSTRDRKLSQCNMRLTTCLDQHFQVRNPSIFQSQPLLSLALFNRRRNQLPIIWRSCSSEELD